MPVDWLDERHDRRADARWRRDGLLNVCSELIPLGSLTLAALLGCGNSPAIVVGLYAACHLRGSHLVTGQTLGSE